MPGRRCAHSEALIWYRDGQERAQAEGSIAICAPARSWVYNPMAGVAEEGRRGCAALGPHFGQLGLTAGATHPRVAGADVVAGRHCWIVALSPAASVCLAAASGLALRVQRLNRLGQPVASFTLTGLSFGVDMAPQLFANPIPGGRGPFVSGLTQPLLDLQEADDLGLFTTLVPSFVPAGLVAQTPTFDTFYDATRGYAPQQRVRQAFADGRGRVSLVLVETSPRSAWDVAPASGPARRVTGSQ